MNDMSPSVQGQYIHLQLQADQLAFSASGNSEPDQTIIASVAPVRALLEQVPLTEANVERAIYAVEDLIMPILRSMPASEHLKISGPDLGKVFELLSVTNDASVPIESVEHLFNEFADHVGGSPIAWKHSVPVDEVALDLVVLREVMHHGGFRSVTLRVS